MEERDVMVVGDVKDHMVIPGQRFASSKQQVWIADFAPSFSQDVQKDMNVYVMSGENAHPDGLEVHLRYEDTQNAAETTNTWSSILARGLGVINRETERTLTSLFAMFPSFEEQRSII